jgi:hypothetical protein
MIANGRKSEKKKGKIVECSCRQSSIILINDRNRMSMSRINDTLFFNLLSR